MTNKKHFPKTINQWDFDYGSFTSLPKIVKFTDFSPSSFELKTAILPLLTKYISQLGNYLSYQAKIVLVNLTPKELTPCKISHFCRCAFKLVLSFALTGIIAAITLNFLNNAGTWQKWYSVFKCKKNINFALSLENKQDIYLQKGSLFFVIQFMLMCIGRHIT